MPNDEAIRAWAEDWVEKFDQTFNEERLRSLIGKKVKLQRPHVPAEEGEEETDPPRPIIGSVIGYSVDTIVTEQSDVHRFSVITAEGAQIALVTSIDIEELPEE